MDEYYRAVRALPAWLARPLSALPPGIAEHHEVEYSCPLAESPAARRSCLLCRSSG